MPSRAELRDALTNRNVLAFLRVIREGESSQTDDAYRTMYGGGRFDSFADHPRQANTANGITSTAAGAYQFLSKTWDGLRAQYGFEDFSPQSQDEGAVALIAGRKALNALIDGNFADVLDRCSYEWASLPPGRYGQPTIDAARAYATFEKWGGSLSHTAAPPAPGPTQPTPKGKKMPAPFVMLAFETLSALLPSLIRKFGTEGSKSSERNAQAAELVIEVAKDALGAANAQEVVEKIQADPAALAKVDKAVQDNWFRLEESGGGGIGGARAFALEATGSGPLWRQIGFGFMLAVLAIAVIVGFGSVMSYMLITADLADAPMKAQILDYFKAAGFIVLGYVFGSSAGSRKKDEAIASKG